MNIVRKISAALLAAVVAVLIPMPSSQASAPTKPVQRSSFSCPVFNPETVVNGERAATARCDGGLGDQYRLRVFVCSSGTSCQWLADPTFQFYGKRSVVYLPDGFVVSAQPAFDVR